MPKLTDYTLRQIRIPEEFYFRLKNYCRTHHKKMFVFYEEMLTWFLEKYENDSLLRYYASFKNGHHLSLWIDNNKIERIKRMAGVAQVSDARIVATALILYLEEKNIFL